MVSLYQIFIYNKQCRCSAAAADWGFFFPCKLSFFSSTVQLPTWVVCRFLLAIVCGHQRSRCNFLILLGECSALLDVLPSEFSDGPFSWPFSMGHLFLVESFPIFSAKSLGSSTLLPSVLSHAAFLSLPFWVWTNQLPLLSSLLSFMDFFLEGVSNFCYTMVQ